MRTGHKRWGAAAVALLVTGALVAYRGHRKSEHRAHVFDADEAADPATPGDRRWRGFAAATPGSSQVGPPTPDAPSAPATPGSWLAPVISPKQLEEVMDTWRHAIIDKNADVVVTLDQAFNVAPLRFGPPLVELAGHDADPRVRAFSTRVLGKYKNSALVDVFQVLLDDKSSFVRQNAAWALGELGQTPAGRTAAEEALADLRHVEADDPAPDVRKAATEALKGLQ
jgi:HEAT repeats